VENHKINLVLKTLRGAKTNLSGVFIPRKYERLADEVHTQLLGFNNEQ